MRIVCQTTEVAYIDHMSFTKRIRPREGTDFAIELDYDYPADGFVTRVVMLRTDDNMLTFPFLIRSRRPCGRATDGP
jgi:hypothetical protein